MEFIGRGASRAVKYHGFATPPQKYQKKSQAKFGKKQLYKNARFNRFART